MGLTEKEAMQARSDVNAKANELAREFGVAKGIKKDGTPRYLPNSDCFALAAEHVAARMSPPMSAEELKREMMKCVYAHRTGHREISDEVKKVIARYRIVAMNHNLVPSDSILATISDTPEHRFRAARTELERQGFAFRVVRYKGVEVIGRPKLVLEAAPAPAPIPDPSYKRDGQLTKSVAIADEALTNKIVAAVLAAMKAEKG